MPSFSSTRSLMRSMVSLGSMSISISLPVSVFTLIIMPPLQPGIMQCAAQQRIWVASGRVRGPVALDASKHAESMHKRRADCMH